MGTSHRLCTRQQLGILFLGTTAPSHRLCTRQQLGILFLGFLVLASCQEFIHDEGANATEAQAELQSSDGADPPAASGPGTGSVSPPFVARRVVVTLKQYNACNVAESLFPHRTGDNSTDQPCEATVAKCYGRRLILATRGCIGDAASSDVVWAWIGTIMDLDSVALVEQDVRTSKMISLHQKSLISNSSGLDLVAGSGAYSFITQYQWNMDMIRARELWTNYSSQGQNTTIAVLDSGMGQGAVDAFDGRIAGGYDFVSDDFWSKDGDGRDPNYYDPGDASEVFCPGDGDSWHGTAVASVAAGDFEGYEGVAPMASVLPVRVLGMCGMGYASDLADGIVWAAGGQIDGVEHSQKPAGEQRRVILMSLSGEGACPSFMQTAVDLAVGKGVALFAAAGNDPALNASDQFPGNCKGVVTVGAWNWKKDEASYSSRNPDIFMPGGDGEKAIPVLINDLYSGVWGMIGTSFAAPHAAGLWAVMGCQGAGGDVVLACLVQQYSANQLQQGVDGCVGKTCSKGVGNGSLIHTAVISNDAYTNSYLINVSGYIQWNAPANGQYRLAVTASNTESITVNLQVNCRNDGYLYYSSSALSWNIIDGITVGSWSNTRTLTTGFFRLIVYASATATPNAMVISWSSVCSSGYTLINNICSMQCNAGQYNSGGVCLQCQNGSYSTFGSSYCTPCPAGTYSSSPASATCTPCPAGTFSTQVGATSNATCNQTCASGFYSGPGSTRCLECPAGGYSTAAPPNCVTSVQMLMAAVDDLATARSGWHSCATMKDSDNNIRLKCFGKNWKGQLGLEDTNSRGDEPDEMGNFLPFVDLGPGIWPKSMSLGQDFSCGIMNDDNVRCWGWGEYGQLGSSNKNDIGSVVNTTGIDLPVVDIGPGLVPVQISSQGGHTCILTSVGSVKCWGVNFDYELGLGRLQNQHVGDDPNEMGANLPTVNLGTGLTASSVVAGKGFTCAVISTNKRLKCWGYNDLGNLGLGDIAYRGGPGTMGESLPYVDLGSGRTVKQVALGWHSSCAILDNDCLKCWGSLYSYEDFQRRGDQPGEMGDNLNCVNLGTGRYAKQVSVGVGVACAVTDTDDVKCWGQNMAYELGYQDQAYRGVSALQMGDNLPNIDLGPGRKAKKVSTGSGWTCVLMDNSQVKCWGGNSFGQLGNGNSQNTMLTPQQVPVDMGSFGNSAQTVCTVTGPGPSSCTPCPAGSFSSAAAATSNATCQLCPPGSFSAQQGSTNCTLCPRGSYSSAQGASQPCTLCPGGTSSADTGGLSQAVCQPCAAGTYSALASGGGQVCMACAAGTFSSAVGANSSAACQACAAGTFSAAPGSTSCTACPLGQYAFAGSVACNASVALSVLSVSSGMSNGVCAWLTGGFLKCWGSSLIAGRAQNIGDGPGEMGNNLAPINLNSSLAVTGQCQGFSHACVIVGDTNVMCWGLNGDGQLGYGDTAERRHPPNAYFHFDGKKVSAIVCGISHTCVLISTNASILCWGGNSLGQLGVGDNVQRNSPTPVNLGAGMTARAIAAGQSFTCAILTNGNVTCWGHNFGGTPAGMLGLGNTANTNTPSSTNPVRLGTGRTALAISAGSYHACAILDNGQLKCWGNGEGLGIGVAATNNIGDSAGEMGDSLQSVNLGGLLPVQVSCSDFFTCVRLNTSEVRCWGRNTDGQLGYGDIVQRLTAPLTSLRMGQRNLTALSITTGRAHTCALLNTGNVLCWGSNGHGQLGIGTGVTQRSSALATEADVGNFVCQACAPGTFVISNCLSCGACPAGSFSSASNSLQCSPCPAGSYSVSGDRNCTLCPAGTYSSSASSAQCTACPAGFYSSATGATSNSTCQPCAVGTYSSANGSSTCLTCPVNKTTLFAGATSSDDCGCVAGKFPSGFSLTEEPPSALTGCAAGSVINTFLYRYFASSAYGATSQNGMFDKISNNANGNYWMGYHGFSDTTGGVTTAPYFFNADSSYKGHFFAIDFGRPVLLKSYKLFLVENSPGVFRCPPRRWMIYSHPSASVFTQGSCCGSATTCSGMNTGDSGWVSIDSRNMGGGFTSGASFDMSSNAVLSRIAVIHINAIQPGSECFQPMVAEWVLYTGAEVCGSCPRGTYGDVPSLKQCKMCPAGSFSNITEASTCSICPSGSFSRAGQSNCTLCPAGTYGAAANSSVCQACPPGTFSSQLGATSPSTCATCPSGSTTLSSGSSNCTSVLQQKVKLAPNSGSSQHTCIIAADNSLKCWGANEYAQLGLGDSYYRGDSPNEMGNNLPSVNLGNGRYALQVCTAEYHTCALLDNYRVKCWGFNGNGWLGLGTAGNNVGASSNDMGDNLPFINLGSVSTVASISCGSLHACAIFANRQMKCWGSGQEGQLGLNVSNSIGSSASQMGDNLPFVFLGNNLVLQEAKASQRNTCAMFTNGRVKCWGRNSDYQLDSTTTYRGKAANSMGDNLAFMDTAKGVSVSSLDHISFGFSHACAITSAQGIRCWGSNGYSGYVGSVDGALGYGDYTERITPGPEINMGATVLQLELGYYFTCVLLAPSSAKCWGNNQQGQLGLGDTNPRTSPPAMAVNIGSGLAISRLYAARHSVCVVLTTSDMKCWGGNVIPATGSTAQLVGGAANTMGDSLPVVNLGSFACMICQPGTYMASKCFSCVSCAPGTFSNGTDAPTCSACPVGTSSASGQSSCTPCPAGRYADAPGTSTCMSCPAGTFSAAIGATSNATCQACAAGTFSRAGNSTCTMCPAGTFSSAGNSSCTSCPAGTFSSAGNSSCTSCPAGTFSRAGNSTCTMCPAGAYASLPAGSSLCAACPVGTSSSALGAVNSSTCQACPIATYAASNGSSQCTSCGVGQTTLSPSSTSAGMCVCVAGRYRDMVPTYEDEGEFPPSAMSSCPMAQGKYTYAAGQSSSWANSYPARYSFLKDGWNTKWVSTGGMYSGGVAGASSALFMNQYRGEYMVVDMGGEFLLQAYRMIAINPVSWNVYGSSNADAWSNPSGCGTANPSSASWFLLDTKAEQYSYTENTVFVPSNVGAAARTARYLAIQFPKILSNNVAAEVMEWIIRGMYAGPMGPGCTPCPAGFYSDATNSSRCAACPAGTYSLAGSSSCTRCPVGSASATPNATSSAFCTLCPAGKYANATGSTLCTPCDPGLFSAQGAHLCAQCPSGTYAREYGSTSCTPCRAGTYADYFGTAECTPCALGMFSNATGATSMSTCAQCPPGTFANATGSTACTPCGDGSYTANFASSSCVLCPRGSATSRS